MDDKHVMPMPPATNRVGRWVLLGASVKEPPTWTPTCSVCGVGGGCVARGVYELHHATRCVCVGGGGSVRLGEGHPREALHGTGGAKGRGAQEVFMLSTLLALSTMWTARLR
jgi:hypothetical protein